MPIQQCIHLDASPQRVYDALFTSEGHSRMTGAPAEIEPEAGGAWSAYGGAIGGRTIEAVPGRRLVQAWRAGSWPAGVYSVVRFELEQRDDGTQLSLHHDAYPADQEPHLAAGWHERYWGPLQAFLAG